MIKQDYDLVVVGGGVAGTFAAIAAGESGCRVLLVEKAQCLGGTETSAMVSELLGVSFHGKPIYGGAVKRFLDTMESSGYGAYHLNVPMSSDPSVHVDRFRCNPEYSKIILEKMVLDAGVDLLYAGIVTRAEEAPGDVRCVIRTDYREYPVESSFLIDATGNAAIAQAMGLPTEKTEARRLQTSTLIIRLSHVDVKALQSSIDDHSIQAVITKGFEQGILRGRIMGFAPIPGGDEATVNVVNANVDHEDAEDVTRGLIETHQQIPEVLDFIRGHVAGCASATLSNIGASLGIRDARRLSGRYTLSFDDLLNGTRFEDTAAIGCYPLDIHDPITNRLIWREVPDLYRIPFRALSCPESERVIVTGRSISASREAFSAIRVMPICMNLGEASGCLAAEMIQSGSTLSNSLVSQVHNRMEKRGMNF